LHVTDRGLKLVSECTFDDSPYTVHPQRCVARVVASNAYPFCQGEGEDIMGQVSALSEHFFDIDVTKFQRYPNTHGVPLNGLFGRG